MLWRRMQLNQMLVASQAMFNKLPILYSFRRCPYAMRARLAIAVSEIQVAVREVVLRDKPAELIAISPKATVPVLQLADGQVIDESLDVMLWALQNNDPAQWLAPGMAEMQPLLDVNDGPFKHHLDRYKYPGRYDDVDAEHHREQALLCLMPLDAQLQKTAYLFGEHPSLVDAAIFPFVRQFAATDAEWFDQQPLAGLHRWRAYWAQSELFKRAMTRWPQWKTGDQEPLFP